MNKIDTHISPRKNIFNLKNRTSIRKNDDHKYVVIVNYINDNEFRVTIRKVNNIAIVNETNEILINIYSLDKKCKERFTINIGNNNVITKNYTVDFKLEKVIIIDQKIPKIIIQTSKSNLLDDFLYNTVMSYIDFNPDYAYNFFDDSQMRNFIKENYEYNVFEAYDKLIPGAYRSDFFRYCYLYKFGGCYFDLKSIPLKPLYKFIDTNDDIILCEDATKKSYYNAIMMVVPNSEIMLNCINSCVEKINNYKTLRNDSRYDALSLTGPKMLYEVAKNIIPKFRHIVKPIKSIIKIKNKKKYALKEPSTYITKYNEIYENIPHYSKLWYLNTVIFNNKFVYDDLTLYIETQPKIEVKLLREKNIFTILNAKPCNYSTDRKIIDKHKRTIRINRVIKNDINDINFFILNAINGEHNKLIYVKVINTESLRFELDFIDNK